MFPGQIILLGGTISSILSLLNIYRQKIQISTVLVVKSTYISEFNVEPLLDTSPDFLASEMVVPACLPTSWPGGLEN